MIGAVNTVTLWENFDLPIKLVNDAWTVLNKHILHLQTAVTDVSGFYCYEITHEHCNILKISFN